MPWDWEQGNAARDFSREERVNPYAPVDYAARLGNAPAAPPYSSPSQLYAAPQPPTWEAPAPMAPGMPYGEAPYPPQQPAEAPYWEQPYGMQEAWQPQQPLWDDSFFYAHAPQEEPVWEPQLRDPFTPAMTYDAGEPQEPPQVAGPAPEAPVRTQRSPIRAGRVAALAVAVIMLVFCALVVGRLVLELARNEKEMETLRSVFREQTGQELTANASFVDLLPAGQTYVPTATPQLFTAAPTPVPTPVIPINDAAAIGLNRRDTSQEAEAAENTPTPNPRTRLTNYPKNPLCNVQESLTGLIESNPDVVGQLVIDGVLNETVLQRNNTYYLNHSPLGVSSEAGSVFADESCTLRMPPENLLLRGQASVPGKVFEPLWKFISGGVSFAASAPSATLTTLYEEERYWLFAVLVAGSDPREAGYFNYASQPTFTTDEAMMAYVQRLKDASLYAFQVDVQPSDRLLTLATLGGENSLVLVYRMAREGE